MILRSFLDQTRPRGAKRIDTKEESDSEIDALVEIEYGGITFSVVSDRMDRRHDGPPQRDEPSSYNHDHRD